MPQIEGIRIQGFKTLKDITIGKLWSLQRSDALTPMTAIIGKNGVGKSTLFDAFGFLADCLKLGVEEACDVRNRGGFYRIRSQGIVTPVQFEIYYREEPSSRPITYELVIDADITGRPFVKSERLRQRRKGQNRGWPFSFLYLNDGKGIAWKGDEVGQNTDNSAFDLDYLMSELRASEGEESDTIQLVELDDKRRLGIATLGALRQHPRIASFRRFIEGWYLSYFTPDSARSLPLAGPQKHLNIHADNLGNVVQFMEREYPHKFFYILNEVASKIPGIEKIDTERTADGRLLLRFNNRGFNDPFYAQQVSDGTLKLFAYLLLLNDPEPPPFICIEEPENGLYHKLLETLAAELRKHASRSKGGSQVFVTTHQPYFVDALNPDEVWVLERGDDGFAKIHRTSNDPLIKNFVDEGITLGSLWYSDYLDKR